MGQNGRAGAVALAATCWAGCCSSADAAGTVTARQAPVRGAPSLWQRRIPQASTRLGEASQSRWVSIGTPRSWAFNPDPVPQLADPLMLFAVGTDPLPSGGQCAPTAAIDALPKNGALLGVSWQLALARL